jgi:hypothetical protein
VQAVRRRGKARPRILYWFRTPPGVRVGRAAIDEQAIRQIEANHPDIEFDWPAILKRRDSESEQPEHPRQARERPGARHAPASIERGRRGGVEAPPVPAPHRNAESHEDAAEEPLSQVVEPGEPATPCEARLGTAGLGRLRARYAELLTRITDRVPEAERQDELKTLAERLNPDAWITDADVTAGLDAYEQTYEMVRSSLPPRRKPGEPV